MIEGIIFDFDGTLFDSMSVWQNAGEIYLRSIGREPAQNLQRVLKPMSLQQSAAYLQAQYRIPLTVEQIMQGINRTVDAFYFDIAAPKPGVAAFVEVLKSRGMRMCVATATDAPQAKAALTRCGLNSYFSAIFTCTQVGCGKDRPIIYRRALAHLGTHRGNTVVIEDAWHAIRTAKEDGFFVTAVFDPYENRQCCIRRTADVYLTDFLNPDAFWEFAAAH